MTVPKYKQCIIVGLSVALIGLIASVLPPVVGWEEYIGLNILYNIRGPRVPPSDVVVVCIDESTVQQLKLPNDLKQWSRSVHARVTEVLSREGAKAVAFDMLFDEARSGSGDGQFAEAIKRAGNVTLCGYMKTISSSPLPFRERKKESINIEKVLFPIPPLKDSAAALAAFPLPKVPIQVNQLWTFKTDAGDLPTLPVVAFQVFALDYYEDWIALLGKYSSDSKVLPQTKSDLLARQNIQNTIQATREIFQTDRKLEGRLKNEIRNLNQHKDAQKIAALTTFVSLYSGPESRFLNFYGPPGTIETLTYYEVLSGRSDVQRFKGKAAFIGMSAEGIRPGERDELYTVFSQETGSNLSGVEIAATAFANILENTFIKPLEFEALLLLVLAWGMALGFISRFLPVAAAIPVIIAVSAAYFGTAYYQFREAHAWYPLVTPILIQAPLAMIFGGVWGYGTVYRERENIRKVSRYYLPEEVIHESARNMADLKARSKTIYGVLLHADIEQYTKFADGRPSQEVMNILNQYCENLFGPVQKNGGMISDFIGDAMVAFWDAGDSGRVDPQVGSQACRAALEIIKNVARFNDESDVQLPIRIGLHAGSITKGNVGAFDHLERRLVGSSVNETTRLDGLNKLLGTRIAVSEQVVPGAGDFFIRPLGNFVMVGVSRPISVHELIGPKEEISDAQKIACGHFEKGLSDFMERCWEEAETSFMEVLKLNGKDGPASYYLGLCRSYKADPPAEGWDGSVVLRAK